ncbi:MAG: UDP-N-acetylmuramoyl-tripeptide--D-alanyl-D-alanine ligase [Alphaproteobacteria bacterium]|nr:MAG: UDP-N-acetylmuramoyl-tripeptide--D-alanyl-D-alanine ligase [Alphaproteobacteria bacterium]
MIYLLPIAYLVFATRRLLTLLHIFQQEEYDGPRFLCWIWNQKAFDRKATVLLLAIWAAGFALSEQSWMYLPLAMSAALLGVAAVESNPLKDAKKKLVLTARAKRILGLALAMLAALSILLAVTRAPLALWILMVQGIPLALIAANAALHPYENYIQRGFWREAHEHLARVNPQIVGITGSFGKTSVKHILSHVLEVKAATLATPGSVNTPMGIARIVRERLTLQHRFFICEMGAYGPGSIRRLCKLARPNIGVITALGQAHFERFGSLATVAKTKFELAEEAIANGGRMIIAEQVLEVPYAREFVTARRNSFTIVGQGADADIRILALRQTDKGIEIDLAPEGKPVTIKAPLFGSHQGPNLALAFAVAKAVGMADADIALALGSAPQVAHRLEVKRQQNGSVLIDDAYNSNPVGFANGLAILDLLRSGEGRRILVTPGMVELGAAHDAEHDKIGTLAGRYVDILLPIMPERIQGLVDRYRAANPGGTVFPCRSFADASRWMNDNLRAGDAVLIENDLPDLYERKLSL